MAYYAGGTKSKKLLTTHFEVADADLLFLPCSIGPVGHIGPANSMTFTYSLLLVTLKCSKDHPTRPV